MGTDDLYKKRRQNRTRKVGTRATRDRILIVCEGTKTEPNYFEGFRLTNVQIVGTGSNTHSVVKKALEEKRRAKRNKERFDQIWCVFDRDSFPSQNFNNAIAIAKQNDIRVAYSNESFELWYLLHFHYYDSAMTRQQYCDKLSQLLNINYQKNAKGIYDLLLQKQQDAIRNAKKLLSKYEILNPENNNPSTTVHLLVRELNKWLNG
jgi:hypothetical protein